MTRTCLLLLGSAFLGAVAAAYQDPPKEKTVEKQAAGELAADKRENPPPAPLKHAPGAMEVHFTDGSTLKLTVRDLQVELQTPYGKLSIPVADIQRLEIGLRISEETAKHIEEAVARLGSKEFRERERGGAALLALGHRAYPALVAAAKSRDAEVARRAETLLEQLRERVPADMLDIPAHDLVQTEHSRIAGTIATAGLTVHTFQFGELPLRLSDVRSLRALDAPEGEKGDSGIQPDPGQLTSYQGQIGKTFRFRVTGVVTGSVWGTGVYTTDSSLAAAAVHAGVLKPGQTAVVKVRIIISPNGFQGSTQHGVTSQAYGVFPAAFQMSR
jgi:hypothetical protein